jgi:hypothetical protein
MTWDAVRLTDLGKNVAVRKALTNGRSYLHRRCDSRSQYIAPFRDRVSDLMVETGWVPHANLTLRLVCAIAWSYA